MGKQGGGGGGGGGGRAGGGRSGGGSDPSYSASRSVRRVSLRAGGAKFSLNIARTWDEEEDQRDFEDSFSML